MSRIPDSIQLLLNYEADWRKCVQASHVNACYGGEGLLISLHCRSGEWIVEYDPSNIDYYEVYRRFGAALDKYTYSSKQQVIDAIK
jgi:hypothetical protein